MFWDACVVAPVPCASGGAAGTAATTPGHWVLLIEAIQYVTAAVVEVWRGIKQGGNDPTGTYTRVTGCNPAATLTVESV